MNQLDLFAHVANAYVKAENSTLTNESLYRAVAGSAGIGAVEMNSKKPIGKSGVERSPLKRAVRWYQQDLRAMGVIEKVPDSRGVWLLTGEGGHQLAFCGFLMFFLSSWKRVIDAAGFGTALFGVVIVS